MKLGKFYCVTWKEYGLFIFGWLGSVGGGGWKDAPYCVFCGGGDK